MGQPKALPWPDQPGLAGEPMLSEGLTKWLSCAKRRRDNKIGDGERGTCVQSF